MHPLSNMALLNNATHKRADIGFAFLVALPTMRVSSPRKRTRARKV
jgi:hypothetical protein